MLHMSHQLSCQDLGQLGHHWIISVQIRTGFFQDLDYELRSRLWSKSHPHYSSCNNLSFRLGLPTHSLMTTFVYRITIYISYSTDNSVKHGEIIMVLIQLYIKNIQGHCTLYSAAPFPTWTNKTYPHSPQHRGKPQLQYTVVLQSTIFNCKTWSHWALVWS